MASQWYIISMQYKSYTPYMKHEHAGLIMLQWNNHIIYKIALCWIAQAEYIRSLFRLWKWAFGLPSHCILVDFGRGGTKIKHVGSAWTDFYHHRPHSNPSPLPYHHHTRSDQAGVKWAIFFNHLSALKHFPDFRSKIDCWEWKSDDWFSFVCQACRWICWM